MITNKEIMDKLQAYFITQDPKVVAKVLASWMIDFNRFMNIETLPEEERDNLIKRMVLNHQELIDFIMNGPKRNMSYEALNDN